MTDEQAMQLALAQGHLALAAGEVPVGAVVLHQGAVIGMGHNAPIGLHDPSAHAEMLALRAAASYFGNYRLEACELFVTLEPCAMCAGAMLHARLNRVVFGTVDPKTGAAGSVIDLFNNRLLNHQTQVLGGVLAPECVSLIQGFFRQQRQKKSLSSSPLREDALRTPLSRFAPLPEMAGMAHYVDNLPALHGLRLHYVEGGLTDATHTVLCLHGRRGWSLIWRHMMSEHMAMGARVLALDLIGFGKSDKPKKEAVHTLSWHAQVILELMERLDLFDVVLVVPDDGDVVIKSLSQFVMALAGQRISRLLSLQTEPLSTQAAEAPYPDQGYQAALRAFQVLASPAKGRSPHNVVNKP